MSRKRWGLSAALSGGLLFALSSVSSAEGICPAPDKPERVSVCHRYASAYVLVEVPTRASDVHMSHGDGVPGIDNFYCDCTVAVDDGDLDGHQGASDNCPTSYNPDQGGTTDINRFHIGAGGTLTSFTPVVNVADFCPNVAITADGRTLLMTSRATSQIRSYAIAPGTFALTEAAGSPYAVVNSAGVTSNLVVRD